MYGAVPPKSKVTARKQDDPNVEMQPLMVDPYFDKNFAPEVTLIYEYDHLSSPLLLPYSLVNSLPRVYTCSQAHFHLSK